jgi:uncharacterized protein (UPF0147 family)
MNPELSREIIDILPVAKGEAALVSDLVAQNLIETLRQADSVIPENIRQQTDQIKSEVTNDLQFDEKTGRYQIADLQLRGIIARSVLRGSGQVVYDLGTRMVESRGLEDKFEIDHSPANTKKMKCLESLQDVSRRLTDGDLEGLEDILNVVHDIAYDLDIPYDRRHIILRATELMSKLFWMNEPRAT